VCCLARARTKCRLGHGNNRSYNAIPRDAHFALVEEARKQSIPFAGHLPFGIRAFEASDAGRAPIEHLTGIAIACSSANKTL